MNSLPWFQALSLAERMSQDIDLAEAAQQLSGVEAGWLKRMVNDPNLRDDIVIEVHANAIPLSAGCLVLRWTQVDLQAAYLFSPLHGVRGYWSSAELQSAVSTQIEHLGLTAPAMRVKTLDGSVFEEWSPFLVDQQVTALGHLHDALEKLPTLQDTLNDSLDTWFTELLPGVQSVHRHRVHIIDQADGMVERLRTLGEVALDTFSGTQVQAGKARRYLDSLGQPVSDADSAVYERQLAEAAAALPNAYVGALQRYWQGSATSALGLPSPIKDNLAIALADDFTQALLQARHADRIDATAFGWLRQAILPADVADIKIATLAFGHPGIAAGQSVPLAGTLAFTRKSQASELFICSPITGLRRYPDPASLQAFYTQLIQKTKRPTVISADHWQRLQDFPTIVLHLTDVITAPFHQQAEQLIALFERDAQQALAQPGAEGNATIALLEDAIDPRARIDQRLAHLSTFGRWRRGAAALPIARSLGRMPQQWVEQLPSLSARLDALYAPCPTLSECLSRLTAPSLAVLTEGKHSLESLHLQLGPEHTYRLTDYFLDQFTGAGLGQLLDDAKVLDLKGRELQWPTPQWLQQLIDNIKEVLAVFYQTRTLAYEQGWVRLGAGVFEVRSETITLHDAILRIDLLQARWAKSLATDLLDTLQAVLDRPDTLANRAALLRGVYLSAGADATPIQLSNLFILQQDAAQQGSVLLWTATDGLSQYDSLTQLEGRLNQSYRNVEDAFNWQNLIGSVYLDSQISPLSWSLTTQPWRGDLLGELYSLQSRQRGVERGRQLALGVRCRFDSELLSRFLGAEEKKRPLNHTLDALLGVVRNTQFNEQLPSVIRQATATQLSVLSLLLERCAQAFGPRLSYLFGIESMGSYARRKLSEQLEVDDPNGPLDPDQIIVTLKHFTAAPASPGNIPSSIPAATETQVLTLTQFALTHFGRLATATVSVSLASPTTQMQPPSGEYVKSLVLEKDLGGHYRELIATKFASTHPEFEERRRRYSDALVALLSAEAYYLALENKVFSAEAFQVLSRALNMPDPLARLAAEGVTLSASRLALQPETGIEDIVQGFYVLGPTGSGAGPLVLYIANSDHRMLQAFDNEQALLAQLRTATDLQALIISRVPEANRYQYQRNGFWHPHVIWSSADIMSFEPDLPPVTLLRKVISDNLLNALFDDHLAMLQSMANAQTVSSDEARWRAFRYLMTLGIEQVSLFLPGRLALLVNAWQSADWLEQAGNAATQHQWGKAVAQLTTAIASLASSRKATHATPTARPNSESILARQQGSDWPAALSEEARDQLQTFERRDVALTPLSPHSEQGIYLEPSTQKHFAAVGGKVYEIRQVQDHWTITKGDELGPRIRRNAQGHWVVDAQGLRGGSPGWLGRYLDNAIIEVDLEERFIIEASGALEMQRSAYSEFLMLQSAHAKATAYLRNCLDNINKARPWEPLPSEVERILSRTFGAPSTPALLSRLRADCNTLFSALLSSALDPTNSPRYVSGQNTPNYDKPFAFTYANDAQKRIFLSKRFFRLPSNVLSYGLPSEGELLTHQQAVTLIHEVSHQMLRTADITYVDASAPFLDQIETITPSGSRFHNETRAARLDGLSMTTPTSELFKVVENNDWRDLKTRDGRGKQTLLALSHRKTLDEARIEFYANAQTRSNIILANADSLALLISELGRQAHVAPGG